MENDEVLALRLSGTWWSDSVRGPWGWHTTLPLELQVNVEKGEKANCRGCDLKIIPYFPDRNIKQHFLQAYNVHSPAVQGLIDNFDYKAIALRLFARMKKESIQGQTTRSQMEELAFEDQDDDDDDEETSNEDNNEEEGDDDDDEEEVDTEDDDTDGDPKDGDGTKGAQPRTHTHEDHGFCSSQSNARQCDDLGIPRPVLKKSTLVPMVTSACVTISCLLWEFMVQDYKEKIYQDDEFEFRRSEFAHKIHKENIIEALQFALSSEYNKCGNHMTNTMIHIRCLPLCWLFLCW